MRGERSAPPACGWGVVTATLAALLVLSLLAVGIAPAAGAATANETAAGSADVDGSEVEELREGGTHIAGAAPSMRWLDGSGSVYVDYSNPHPLIPDAREDWEAGEILERGERVEVDEIRLHAQRERDADQGTYTVVVVHWELDHVPVQRGNETIYEPVARNVSEQRTNVTFTGAFDSEEVSLQRSDEPRQVTMWLEDAESGEPVEGARWRFRHDSAATTQDAGISTYGDLLTWVGLQIVLPLLVGIVGNALGVRAAINRAAKGPGKGILFWAIVGGGLTTILVAAAYMLIADLLVALPLAIPIGLVVVMTIIYLETYQVGVEEILFVRPELEPASTPSGEKAVDIVSVESTRETVVTRGPGTVDIVRDGIRPFLSRCFGGSATLEGAEQLATRFEVDGKRRVREDAMVFVHPLSDADGVIDYSPEGFGLDLPDLESRGDVLRALVGATVIVAFALSVGATWGLLAGWLALAGAVAAVAVRPRQGEAHVEIAPAHMRAAFASMLYLGKELDDADTIEAARCKIVEQEARSEKEVEQALTERDATLVGEMFDTDVEAAVDSLDDESHLDRLLANGEAASADKEVPSDD